MHKASIPVCTGNVTRGLSSRVSIVSTCLEIFSKILLSPRIRSFFVSL